MVRGGRRTRGERAAEKENEQREAKRVRRGVRRSDLAASAPRARNRSPSPHLATAARRNRAASSALHARRSRSPSRSSATQAGSRSSSSRSPTAAIYAASTSQAVDTNERASANAEPLPPATMNCTMGENVLQADLALTPSMEDAEAQMSLSNVPESLRDLIFLSQESEPVESEEEQERRTFVEGDIWSINAGLKRPQDEADWGSLSAEEQAQRVSKFNKERRRLYAQRSRRLGKSDAAFEKAYNANRVLKPRTFDEIKSIPKTQFLRVGDEFDTAKELDLRVRELCECTSNIPLTRLSMSEGLYTATTHRGQLSNHVEQQGEGNDRDDGNDQDADVTSEVPTPAPPGQHMLVKAKRVQRSGGQLPFCWRVTAVKLPAHGVSQSTFNSAYTKHHLAPIVQNSIRADPSKLQNQHVNGLLQDYTRLPLKPSTVSDVKHAAYKLVFGDPSDNVQFAEALVLHLRSQGYKAEATFFDGQAMVQRIMEVQKSEHKIAEQTKVAKLQDLRNRGVEPTPLQRAEFAPMREATFLSEFSAEHSEMLQEIRTSANKYLSGLMVAFRGARRSIQKLLRVFACDATHGILKGKDFTILSLVGLSSNNNIVPIAVGLLCSSESEASWKAFALFVRNAFPDAAFESCTAITEQEKGMKRALQEIFPAMRRFVCSHHRERNLHGSTNKECVDAYKKMVHMNHQVELEDAKVALREHFSNDSMCNKVFRIESEATVKAPPDAEQFPAAAVAAGATLYGQTASSFAEPWKSALRKIRALDPVTALQHIVDLENKWFFKHQASVKRRLEEGKALTPEAQTALDAINSDGVNNVQEVGDGINFYVEEEGSTTLVVTLPVTLPGETRFTENACTCGGPKVCHFPCRHVVAVARREGIREDQVVPEIWSTGAWKAQYPDDVPHTPLNSAQIRLESRRKKHHKLPKVGGPVNMLGRPTTARKKSALERSKRYRARIRSRT
ncbi:Hypothetical protein SCF082_LOCUS40769 [Durusdinium trenchii]|uniref:SWIM-type domain-containing protein n=1 Tax=Durusdinium trenchii TaxID=1381693 RepID=A0ABP0QDV6_9DINO